MDVQTLIPIVDATAVLLCCAIWLGAAWFLRVRKQKSGVFLLFFTVFFVYVVAVLEYTVFQFQSLFLLNLLSPNSLRLKAGTVTDGVNLVPLVTLRPADLETSLLNVLMLVPFGFGLPFITTLRMRAVVVLGALFSVAIELLQLLTGLLAGGTFRTVDVNDVIFNTAGAVIGSLLFVAFLRIYRRVYRRARTAGNPILNHIAERPQAGAWSTGARSERDVGSSVATGSEPPAALQSQPRRRSSA